MTVDIHLEEPAISRFRVTIFRLSSARFAKFPPPPGPDSNFRLPFVFFRGVQYGKFRRNPAMVGPRE